MRHDARSRTVVSIRLSIQCIYLTVHASATSTGGGGIGTKPFSPRWPPFVFLSQKGGRLRFAGREDGEQRLHLASYGVWICKDINKMPCRPITARHGPDWSMITSFISVWVLYARYFQHQPAILFFEGPTSSYPSQLSIFLLTFTPSACSGGCPSVSQHPRQTC